jgi:hypothetical protein
MKRIAAFKKALVKMDFNKLVTVENFIANFPFFLFLVLLTLVYISNSHSVEGTIRRMDDIKAELKEVKWNLQASQSDLQCRIKQTEVAKTVEPMGLKEIVQPPKKIQIEE